MVEVTCRPILFSAPMVRAILDGSKTQTRRVVKDRFIDFIGGSGDDRNDPSNWGFGDKDGCWHVLDQSERVYQCGGGSNGETFRIECHYGSPGDRLWVREEHYRFGHWEPVEGAKTKGGRQKWKFSGDAGGFGPFNIPKALYDGEIEEGEFRRAMSKRDPATPAWHKRLARFMHRAFSRITLEIVSVRVERLQDISEEDAIAEGIERGEDFFQCPTWKDYLPDPEGASWFPDDPIGSYRTLWESINGPGSWDANPFVWVVEFRRVP